MTQRLSQVPLAMLLLLGVGYLSGNFLPQIRFDRERIDIWIFQDQLHVVGLYHYRNDSSVPQVLTIGVPFPQGEGLSEPGYFSVSETDESGRDGPVVPTFGLQRKIRMAFRSGEGKWLKVEYIQHAARTQGRYILLTTRDWKYPLERGEYYVHPGQGIGLTGSDYQLDPAYSFRRTDFYPDHDWHFCWRKAERE